VYLRVLRRNLDCIGDGLFRVPIVALRSEISVVGFDVDCVQARRILLNKEIFGQFLARDLVNQDVSEDTTGGV
jgi:hypothetical protein